METFANTLFIISIGWLFTHELDAIKKNEWRMFFFLNPFSDETAYRIFTALHIPLFAFMVGQSHLRNFQITFDGFLIIHAGLHLVLRNHPKYEFDNWFSNVLIIGVVPIAIIHLLLLLA